jgi:hypothetical protein
MAAAESSMSFVDLVPVSLEVNSSRASSSIKKQTSKSHQNCGKNEIIKNCLLQKLSAWLTAFQMLFSKTFESLTVLVGIDQSSFCFGVA